MFTITWLLGLAAAFSTLSICRAEAQHSRLGGVAFDKPLRRALGYGLAAASLGLLLFYAMLGDGVVIPLIAIAVMSGLATGAVRYASPTLAAFGGVAIVLALISFACGVAAFQQVYGDYFFGFDDPFAR
jgi:hypothetical protein